MTNIPLCSRGDCGLLCWLTGSPSPPLGGPLPHQPSQCQLHLQGLATSPRVTQVGLPSLPSLLFQDGGLPMLPLVGHHRDPQWSGGVVAGAPGTHCWKTGNCLPTQHLHLGTRGMSTPQGHVLPYLYMGRYGSLWVHHVKPKWQ